MEDTTNTLVPDFSELRNLLGPDRDGATLVRPALAARGRSQYVSSETALEVFESLVEQFRDDAEQCCSDIGEWQAANPSVNGVLQAWVEDNEQILTRRVALWREIAERQQRLQESYDSDEDRAKALKYLLTLDAVKNGRAVNGEDAERDR